MSTLNLDCKQRPWTLVLLGLLPGALFAEKLSENPPANFRFSVTQWTITGVENVIRMPEKLCAKHGLIQLEARKQGGRKSLSFLSFCDTFILDFNNLNLRYIFKIIFNLFIRTPFCQC